MRLQARDAVNLLSGERRPAAELPRVVAMAGIGHPPRFFATLEKLNVEVVQKWRLPIIRNISSRS